MWQKAHPIGLRVGFVKSWPSERYASSKKQSANFFVEDVQIRNLVDTFYHRSGIAKIVIRKTEDEGEVILFTAKTGVVMGKDGAKLKEFEKQLHAKTGKPFSVTVKAIKKPELSAKVMAEYAATQIEGRMPFRRVAKQLVQKVMSSGAQGVKVQVAGRLGGVDIARSEEFSEGRVPLQTLRSDIDYNYTPSITKYGVIGVKVWISKGEIYTKGK